MRHKNLTVWKIFLTYTVKLCFLKFRKISSISNIVFVVFQLFCHGKLLLLFLFCLTKQNYEKTAEKRFRRVESFERSWAERIIMEKANQHLPVFCNSKRWSYSINWCRGEFIDLHHLWLIFIPHIWRHFMLGHHNQVSYQFFFNKSLIA